MTKIIWVCESCFRASGREEILTIGRVALEMIPCADCRLLFRSGSLLAVRAGPLDRRADDVRTRTAPPERPVSER